MRQFLGAPGGLGTAWGLKKGQTNHETQVAYPQGPQLPGHQVLRPLSRFLSAAYGMNTGDGTSCRDLSTCDLEKWVNIHCAVRPRCTHHVPIREPQVRASEGMYTCSLERARKGCPTFKGQPSTGPAHLAGPEDMGAGLQAPSALCLTSAHQAPQWKSTCPS